MKDLMIFRDKERHYDGDYVDRKVFREKKRILIAFRSIIMIALAYMIVSQRWLFSEVAVFHVDKDYRQGKVL